MTDPTHSLVSLLQTLGGVDIFDGETPREFPITQGVVNVYGSMAPDPFSRALSGQAHRSLTNWTLVCSMPDSRGARALASRVIQLIDGAVINSELVRVDLVTDPLRDNSNPLLPAYSISLSVTHHSQRSHN